MIEKNKGGRPALKKHEKREHRKCFYLNDLELYDYKSLKNRLSSSSPALDCNDIYRLVLKYQEDILLFLESKSEVTFLHPHQRVFKRKDK